MKETSLKMGAVGAAALFIYIAIYLMWRPYFLPCANLRYYYYSEDERVDTVCYYGFYPLRQIDTWFIGCVHWRDRTIPSAANLGP